MDPMLDRALTYLDQFDWSNGYLIHLNRDPIKQGLKSKSKQGLNLEIKDKSHKKIETP